MANRTGTYVAFDGMGEYDPSKSDFRYYATIQAWNANRNIDFKITNSHEKTYAVQDSSSKKPYMLGFGSGLEYQKICW